MRSIVSNIGLRILWFAKLITKVVAAAVVAVAIAATIVIQLSGDPDFVYLRPDTLINDVTQLNPVVVARTLRPRSTEEVAEALRSSSGPVSIGGGRYSQGGQIAYPQSLHLDMRSMNRVLDFDPERKSLHVQAGITWRDIQEHIDPADLAVRIMQSYANFTVGGSLGVNVHGRYIGEGPLVRSVESITLVLADGSIVQASPSLNPELFYGAIGGYGGIGVITEAELSLVDNTKVERTTVVMPVDDYADHFTANVRDNADVVFHNADLYPPDYQIVRDVSWLETDKPVTIEQRLIAADAEYTWQPRIVDWVAGSNAFKVIRRTVIDPWVYRDDRVVWRNFEASYDVAELEPDDRDEYTYALREYFVPVEHFDEFVARMRDIFTRYEANIINVSVRHALEDPGTLLAWARREMFAFVVYYRQPTQRAARDDVREWSRQMIDAVIALDGTWYLPYQVFATPDQFRAGYPRANEFFALKARVDPENRFRNRLWQQHYPENRSSLTAIRENTPNYFRGVEQTLLTIPEWYLVFNPVEYAEFLESGRNPDDFPFFASIDEFWTLYDRVRAIARARGYPPNSEYTTMLRIIGISTTVEFMLKGTYEATVGRLSRWTAGGEETPEERLIALAHRAYSDTIFDVAWYDFDFLHWVGKLWGETELFGPGFIRKIERRLSFTLEFSVKAAYAKLIRFASKTTYGEKDDRIYLTIDSSGSGSDDYPTQMRELAADGSDRIVSIPRWGPFTEIVPELARTGTGFRDISGNHEIAASIIGPAQADFDPASTELLFRSRVFSHDDLQRRVVIVPVSRLGSFMSALDESDFRLEHLYDY